MDSKNVGAVSFLLIAAIGIWLFAKGSAVASMVNLLLNPGFETTPAYPDWTQEYSGDLAPLFSWPEIGAAGGNAAGIEYASWDGVAEQEAHWMQKVTVTPGAAYNAAGKAKTEDVVGEDGALIRVMWFDESNAFISLNMVSNYMQGTNDWQTFSAPGLIAPANAAYAYFDCALSYCSGRVLFDDMVFSQI